MERDLNHIKAFALDMDGVMRIGRQAIPGIHPLLAKIKEKGMKAMIITNECRYTESKIRHDLYDMQIDWPDDWTVYTSADSVRDFLIQRFQKSTFNSLLYQQSLSRPNSSISRLSGGGSFLNSNQQADSDQFTQYIGVVGEKGLKYGVKQAIRILIDEHKHSIPIRMVNLPPFDDDNCELFLVIGTLYNLDITDLEKVLRWIKRGAKVIVSCPDTVDPELKGDFSICMPRHILHMVRLNAATDYYCVGKPNATMARAIQKNFPDLLMKEILFVGDSLNTDIKVAEENGMLSALVLTGNTKLEELKKSCVQPDMVFNTLDELAEIL